VLTVIATDCDSGSNGTLVYRLEDVPLHNDLPMFAVDPHNGLITTVQSNVLDRELVAEYQLTVVATDRGRPRMSGAFDELVQLILHYRVSTAIGRRVSHFEVVCVPVAEFEFIKMHLRLRHLNV